MALCIDVRLSGTAGWPLLNYNAPITKLGTRSKILLSDTLPDLCRGVIAGGDPAFIAREREQRGYIAHKNGKMWAVPDHC